MKAKILKAVVSNGKKLTPGSIVDITGWRNAKTLVSGRYVEILDEQEPVKPKAKEETPVVVKETTPVVTPTATAKPKATAKISDK